MARNEVYGGLGGADDSQWLAGSRAARANVQKYQAAAAAARADGNEEAAQEIEAELMNGLDSVREAMKSNDPEAIEASLEGAGPRAQLLAALRREYDAADQMKGLRQTVPEGSGLSRVAAGGASGLAELGMKVGNLVGAVSDDDLGEFEQRNAGLWNDPAGAAGRFGTNLTLWGLGGEGEAAALAKLASKYRGISKLTGATLKNPVARGAAKGARQGAEMGAVEAGPNHRLRGAVIGGAAGGAGAGVFETGAALTRGVASGVKPTAEAATLRQQLPDGTLTWGQTNPDSLIGRWEHNPISRSIAKPGIDNANAEINLLAANKASVPLADVKPLADNEMGDLAERILNGERGSAIRTPQSTNLRTKNQMFDASDDSFKPYFDALDSYAASAKILSTKGQSIPLRVRFEKIGKNLDPKVAEALQSALTQAVRNAKSAGGMTMKQLRDLRSDIRKLTPAVSKDTTSEQRATIRALEKAVDSVNEAIMSQLPPGAQKLWKATDGVYGANKVLEEATNATGAEQAITGAQLERAATRDTKAKLGPRAAARGEDSTRVRDRATGKSIEGSGLRDLGRQWQAINKSPPHTGETGVTDKTIEFLTHLPGGIAGMPFAGMSRSAWGRRAIQGKTPFQAALRRAQGDPFVNALGNTGSKLAAPYSVELLNGSATGEAPAVSWLDAIGATQ